MSQFDAVFNLSHKVAVYVPGTCGVADLADTSAWVTRAQVELSTLFGGSTTTNGQGGWVSKDAGLVIEPVKIVSSYCEALTSEALDAVYNLAQVIKNDLAQEEVSVEIDNKLYFV